MKSNVFICSTDTRAAFSSSSHGENSVRPSVKGPWLRAWTTLAPLTLLSVVEVFEQPSRNRVAKDITKGISSLPYYSGLLSLLCLLGRVEISCSCHSVIKLRSLFSLMNLPEWWVSFCLSICSFVYLFFLDSDTDNDLILTRDALKKLHALFLKAQ